MIYRKKQFVIYLCKWNYRKERLIRVNLKRNNLLKKFTTITIIILLLQQDRDRHQIKVRQKRSPIYSGEERTSLALSYWEWMWSTKLLEQTRSASIHVKIICCQRSWELPVQWHTTEEYTGENHQIMKLLLSRIQFLPASGQIGVTEASLSHATTSRTT